MLKKILINWINKHINKGYNYLFMRWFASLVEDKDSVNYVLYKIYKNYSPESQLFTNVVYSNRFTDIFIVGNVIYIYTMRPGLWIGTRGTEIDTLLHVINYTNYVKVNNYTIQLIEDKGTNKSQLINGFITMNENY